MEQLMKAAYAVFAEKGYEKATVDDIATAAGYTKGAFYWHFSSKEALFLEIIDYRVKVQQKVFQNNFNVNKDLITNIHDVFGQMVEFTKKDNWTPIFIEFLAHAARNEKVKEKMVFMYANWRDFMERTLITLQEVGYLSKEINTKFTASVIIALFDGFNLQSLVDPEVINTEDVFQLLKNILITKF